MFRDLLDRGANVHHEDASGNTALHCLFRVFEVNPLEARKIGELLLEHGVKVNVRNADWFCPIHLAVKRGNTCALEFAIEKSR